MMERRKQRRTLSAQCQVPAPEVCDRRNTGSCSNNIRITDLYRVWPVEPRLMAQRLPVTANRCNTPGLDLRFGYQFESCIPERLAHPVIEPTDRIDRATLRLASCDCEIGLELVRIFMLECGDDLALSVTEFDQRRVDTVYAGTRHQADIQTVHLVQRNSSDLCSLVLIKLFENRCCRRQEILPVLILDRGGLWQLNCARIAVYAV